MTIAVSKADFVAAVMAPIEARMVADGNNTAGLEAQGMYAKQIQAWWSQTTIGTGLTLTTSTMATPMVDLTCWLRALIELYYDLAECLIAHPPGAARDACFEAAKDKYNTAIGACGSV
ncbi:MAG: hypothetical protein AAGA55_02115 [Planctomycetota bacterium]